MATTHQDKYKDTKLTEQQQSISLKKLSSLMYQMHLILHPDNTIWTMGTYTQHVEKQYKNLSNDQISQYYEKLKEKFMPKNLYDLVSLMYHTSLMYYPKISKEDTEYKINFQENIYGVYKNLNNEKILENSKIVLQEFVSLVEKNDQKTKGETEIKSRQ